MRQLTTFLTIALSIFLVTKMSFAQGIKVNSNGEVGIDGDPSSSYELTVNGPMKVTGDITGHDNHYDYGYMTMGGNYNTVEIGAGSYSTWGLWVGGDAGGTTSWNGSDRKLKRNIRYLDENQILSKIQKLSGRKYQFKDRQELIQMHENNQVRFPEDTIDLEAERAKYGSVSDSELQQKLGYDKTITLDGKQYGIRISAPYISGRERYGLIAQEVKEEFPELVKYDSTGMIYYINYDGFIPVLLEAVKAQQQQINEKSARINDDSIRIANLEKRVAALEAEVDTIKAQCCSSTTEEKSNPTGTLKVNETPQAQLYQNIPNPFKESTRIEYFLPKSTGKAQLYIYDMQGTPVKQFSVRSLGEGSITLQGGSLQPGMYLYTLMADGKMVDTKRMILTD